MKKITILFTLLFSLIMIKAQLQDGSYAPNWNLQDLDGVDHTLYDYTNAYIPVVTDMFAITCGPCWSYQQSGNLENLYNSWGPDGENKVMVFGIESRSQTTTAAQITTSNSYGNWADVPYPVMGAYVAPNTSSPYTGSTVVGAYNLAYFPYITLVCPNRKYYEMGQKTTSAAKTFITSKCPDIPEAVRNSVNNIGFFDITIKPMYCNANLFNPTLKIQNTGSANLTSFNIEYFIDGNPAGTSSWTGSKARWEIIEKTVALSGVTLTPGNSYTFKAVISMPNGETDEYTADNEIEKIFQVAEYPATLTLNIKTDNYPSEVDWLIYETSSPSVVIDNATLGNTGTSFNYSICADRKCYTFKINDQYGDGMNYPSGTGANTYALLKLGSDTVVFIKGDSYTTERTVSFCLTESGFTGGSVGISENQNKDVSIYPNPTSDKFYIDFTAQNSGELLLDIYDITGKLVKSINVGSFGQGIHTAEIDVTGLNSGVYFVNTKQGNSVSTQKLTIY